MEQPISTRSNLLSATSGVAFHAADSLTLLAAVYLFFIKPKNVLNWGGSMVYMALSAILFAILGGLGAGWLQLAAVLVLPYIGAHGQYGPGGLFVTSCIGFYRAIKLNNDGLMTKYIVVFLYGYFATTSIDRESKEIIANAIKSLNFKDVRKLIRTRRVRELVIDDLWKLSERFTLKCAYADFKYDTSENMFAAKAIIRMAWRSLAIALIVSSVSKALMITRNMLYVQLMQTLDPMSNNNVYAAISFFSLLVGASIAGMILNSIEKYLTKEKERIGRAIDLEVFRIPLLDMRLRMSGTGGGYLDSEVITHAIYGLINIIPKSIGMTSVSYMLFQQIGWAAFAPAMVYSSIAVIKWAVEKTFGDIYMWNSSTYLRSYRPDINEIHSNIRSIKMFAWERKYLDINIKSSVQKKMSSPWLKYPSIAMWHIICIIEYVQDDLALYIAFYMFLSSSSCKGIVFASGYIFQIKTQLDYIVGEFKSIKSTLDILKYTVKSITNLEDILKGQYVKTVVHSSNTNSDVEIVLDKCQFIWRSKPVLSDVSFKSSNSRELVAVTGKTGSGKSSLLLAICGQMEMTEGSGTVNGRIAYLEQSPWIMKDTLRANILFGREFEEDFYWKVIHACAFADDLKTWPKGDMTVIGERGVNISGGQRARLALARTVYSRADIYIMDDPLSAVDAQVKHHILEHVILDTGLLANKLRIVSTNSNHIIPYSGQIICIEDEHTSITSQSPKEYTSCLPELVYHPLEFCLKERQTAEFDLDINEKVVDPSNNELQSKSKMKRSIYENIMFALKFYTIGHLAYIILAEMFSDSIVFLLRQLKIGVFRNTNSFDDRNDDAILQYIKLEIYSSVYIYVYAELKKYFSANVLKGYVERKSNIKFAQSIIYAPLSLFDSTVKEQLSEEFNNTSRVIPYDVNRLIAADFVGIFSTMLQMYQVYLISPLLLLMVPIVSVISMVTENYTNPAFDSLQKLQQSTGINRNRINNLISDGKMLIRLFGVEKHFTSLYIDQKDMEYQLKDAQASIVILSNIIYTISSLFNDVILALIAILLKQIYGMGISAAEFKITEQLMRKLSYQLDSAFRIPEKLRKTSEGISEYRDYADIEPEAPYIIENNRPSKEWPEHGKIEFCNYSMKYRKDLKPALKNINLTIMPGEKIGIVGRTGAGKSTFVKSLFRLVHGNDSGTILIDGQDISKFGVGDLRPRIGIIPQESTMLRGSFADNLDPLDEFTKDDMWAALEKCHMIDIVKQPNNDDSDEADASNYQVQELRNWNEKWKNASWKMRLFMYVFMRKPRLPERSLLIKTEPLDKMASGGSVQMSDGQKQLFSLCRVLMRKRRVLVLDEATANVDTETDRMMHEVMRKEFKDCTVLTIAHRLETIMNSDRVIVIDHGEVVEIGKPQDLLKKENGCFAELARTNDFGSFKL